MIDNNERDAPKQINRCCSWQKTEIDTLNAEILNELRENCKQPISGIAKKLNVHPNRIIDRIKCMEKDGIITRYQAHVDYSKLGFNTHAFVSIQLKGVADKAVLGDLARLPEVAALFWISGLFDCAAIVRTTTRDALARVLEKFGKNRYVGKTRTDVVFETYKHHYQFNPLQKKLNLDKTKKIEREKANYDNLDRAMLRELKENSKISYRELAKKLKTHQNTLIHRVKRLEESNVITKYVADIDYYKIGYGISAISMIRLKGTEIPNEETIEGIVAIPEIKSFYGVTGTYDCIAVLRAKTIDDLLRVIQEMYRTTKSIKRTATSTIFYTYKDLCEYNPFLNMPLLDHEVE